MSVTKRRPRYGWHGPTAISFGIGARVRYAVPDITPGNYPHVDLYTGDEGVIVGGDGKPSTLFGSRNSPLWREGSA